jgi:hypothetical protein
MTDGRQRHTHLWHTHSTHGTLEGLLRYQYCTCGQWRLTTDDEEVARVSSIRRSRPSP